MQLNSDSAQHRNQVAVVSFLDYWKPKRKFALSVPGRGLSFCGRIRYRWLGNELRGDRPTLIKTTGMQPYGIDIEEGGPFSVETLHLGFLCQFGSIRFSKKRALIIKGDSTKLGGDYFVRIRPVRLRKTPISN